MRFKVDGMSCEHCMRAVGQAVQGVAPGAAAAVDLASGTVTVSGDPDPAAIVAAIQAEGYQAQALPN